tara:strand:+ start:680 stop:1756 length:1077 start_codon:yes stop_codon:yes gene_type:complete
MDRDTLFKHLGEHYKVPRSDWWQHKQSGKWVLTHAAVQKIAYQKTPEGYIITLPGRADIDWLKKGVVSEGGIHGAEIVIGAEFQLVTEDGELVRKVYAIGEANGSNVSKGMSHGWAMAWKRMFDRGVLDVLAFASHGFYSAEEAETFSNPANRVANKKAPAAAKAPVAPAPAPAPPVAVTVARQSPRPEPRPPIVPSNRPAPPMPTAPPRMTSAAVMRPDRDSIISLFASSGDGAQLSRGDICESTGLPTMDFLPLVSPLLEDGILIRVGEKRGTKYQMASSPKHDQNDSALTKDHYNDLWRDASEKLRKMGISQMDIARIVHSVTGHESAISAFKSGDMSINKIEKIFVMGQQSVAP